jgi:hypothetical protein
VQQSREEMEVLFTLLVERYERGSVILTSNLPFSKWEEIFKDPMTTAVAIDRLVHHSIILELDIPSYRKDKPRSIEHRMPQQRCPDRGITRCSWLVLRFAPSGLRYVPARNDTERRREISSNDYREI